MQLQRTQTICTIKCTICPEHKVHSKPYSVTLIVDEQEDDVLQVTCHDCPASTGGCKHAVAFLMWCHRRSEEPSCTSVQCYWKKSTLSKVGSSIKIMTTKEMTKKKVKSAETSIGDSVVEDFLIECKKRKNTSCQYLKHENDYVCKKTNTLSLHYLMCSNNTNECDDFLNQIAKVFNDINIRNVEKETRNQHKSGLWYELRYGRITASKCFEVSRCKTTDGSLVATILGGRTIETTAIKRGRMLEDSVRKSVEKKLGKKIEKCGLFISEENPMIAGSPDGICEKNTTIEIKCPSTKKTENKYIKDGAITKQYYAQVQVQMYCANVNKSYFCVASSGFEKDNKVNIIEIAYDQIYVSKLLHSVISFWKRNIFPILYETVQI